MADREKKVSFKVLAAQQGWTKESLRKCYDGEKIQLPPGVEIVGYPPEYLEDPFKNALASKPDRDYATLENIFYDNLKQMSMASPKKSPKAEKQVEQGQQPVKRASQQVKNIPQQAAQSDEDKVQSLSVQLPKLRTKKPPPPSVKG